MKSVWYGVKLYQCASGLFAYSWFWLNQKIFRFQVIHFHYDPLYGHIVVCRTLDNVIFDCTVPFWKGEQLWTLSLFKRTAPSLTVLKHTDIKNSTHLIHSFVTLNQRFEAFDQLYFEWVRKILNVKTVQGRVFQNVVFHPKLYSIILIEQWKVGQIVYKQLNVSSTTLIKIWNIFFLFKNIDSAFISIQDVSKPKGALR